SISPKLAGSAPDASMASRWRERHERARHAPAELRQLAAQHHHQLKVVAAPRHHCQDVELSLAEVPGIDRQRVIPLQQRTPAEPLARQAEWLEPSCREHSLRYCPRKHIEWYGLVRGT